MTQFWSRVLRYRITWPVACKLSKRLGQRAATRLLEEVADADIRRLSTAISPVTKKPTTMTRTAPMAQTVQTAIDRPPASAGAHPSTASMAGVRDAIIEFKLLAYSDGIQGASQTGTCRASIDPAPPAKVPAFTTVQTAIEWNAQAASDQSIKRLTTTNQLSA